MQDGAVGIVTRLLEIVLHWITSIPRLVCSAPPPPALTRRGHRQHRNRISSGSRFLRDYEYDGPNHADGADTDRIVEPRTEPRCCLIGSPSELPVRIPCSLYANSRHWKVPFVPR